jgi:hypothetical protein
MVSSSAEMRVEKSVAHWVAMMGESRVDKTDPRSAVL